MRGWRRKSGNIMGGTLSIRKNERDRIGKFLGKLLGKQNGILFAYLHGSFAEGRPFKDIDVAVFVDEEAIPKERALDFEMSTSMKLEKEVKLPLDLKVINYAPLGFQYYSTTGPLIMCKEDDLRVDFLTRVRSLYFDFKPSSERFLLEMIYAE
jgi:predicted nucleotidyltransferase